MKPNAPCFKPALNRTRLLPSATALVFSASALLAGCAETAEEPTTEEEPAVAESKSALTLPSSCLYSCDATCDGQAISIIDTLVTQLNNAGIWMGAPVDGNYWKTGCEYYRQYGNGSIVVRADIGAHWTHGGINEMYNSLGFIWSWLGSPTSDEQMSGSTWFNTFENGYIFSDPSWGTHAAKYWFDGRTLYDVNVPTGNSGTIWPMIGINAHASYVNSIDPFRAAIIEAGLNEVYGGWSGDAARARYGASGKWCSEWVRYVYKRVGLWMERCVLNSWFGCINHTSTNDPTTVDDWRKLFSAYGRLYTVSAGNVEPGDYLAMKNNSHSAIAVAVSPDLRSLWIMQGNVNDAVLFEKIDYVYPDGSINPLLNAVGKVDASLRR